MNPVAKTLLIVVAVVLGLAGICFIGLSALFGNPILRPRYPAYDALMAAVEKHDAKQVRQLLAQGTDPNKFPDDPVSIQAEEDFSVLNCAVDEGNEDVVKALLDYHADPNLGDGWHYNPLAAAASNNNVAMMKLLLRRGAIINDDPGGSYALYRAAMDSKVEATAFLLDHGANPKTNFDSKAGESLLDLVRSTSPNPEIIALLEKAGAHSAGAK